MHEVSIRQSLALPLPEPTRDRQRIELDALPPGGLVTVPVQLAMMDPTHRNGKLIADLASQGPRLGKAQMVGVCGRSTADQAWLPGHELAMVLVAQPDGLGRNAAASMRAPSAGAGCSSGCAWRLRSATGCWPRRFGLLIVEGRELGLETRFNQLRVGVRQRVLGWQVLMRPDGGLVAGFAGRPVRRASDPAAARIGREPEWGPQLRQAGLGGGRSAPGASMPV